MRDPSQSGQQWRVLSQRGDDLARLPAGDELKRIRAGEVLGRALHSRIEGPVRREWNAGDCETAIFKATREVEIAVRDALGDDGKGLVGVKLMNKAFGPGGKLLDDEQEGTRAIYAGLIGVFKNPGSRRHFEPDDPVQAAGIIRPLICCCGRLTTGWHNAGSRQASRLLPQGTSGSAASSTNSSGVPMAVPQLGVPMSGRFLGQPRKRGLSRSRRSCRDRPGRRSSCEVPAASAQSAGYVGSWPRTSCPSAVRSSSMRS